jgi:hypothetical protein
MKRQWDKRPGGATSGFEDRRPISLPAQAIAAARLIQLHRTIGNAGVGRLLGAGPTAQRKPAAQLKENRTGMPDRLKEGLEALSGLELSDVRVHYNSSEPAEHGAYAFARGSDIHLGPGQEQHLPHEGWHIVQQRQGRVAPTRQMKDGRTANDDDTLEREADEMGRRALEGPAAAVPQAPRQAAASADPGRAPYQFVLVKLQQARSKGGKDKYVVAKQGDQDAVDTSTMTLSQKRQVLEDLQKEKRFAAQAQELIKEINAITGKIDEKEIVKYGEKLDKLLAKKASGTAFDKSDNDLLHEISFRLLKALDYLGSFDEGESEALKVRALLQVQLDKLFKLDKDALKQARTLAEVEFEDVTAEEIDAYRKDILSSGVWGGGAEASVIAQGVGVHLDLFFLDGEGKYVKADTIGDRNGTASQYAILNLGTHYVVVDADVEPGTVHREAHIRYNPSPDGDCMFNALHFALTDGNLSITLNWQTPGMSSPIPLNQDNFLTESRRIASENMSDDSVRLSIEEILLSGQTAGVGPNLKRFIDFRKYGKKELLEMINKYGIKQSEVVEKLKSDQIIKMNKPLPELLDKYEQNCSKQPVICEKFLRSILGLIFSKSVESEELIEDDSSLKPERSLRKEESDKYRKLYNVENSDNNPKQLIVTIDEGESSKEFVLDRIGQLVPRYVYRGISDYNIAELEQEGFIYPTFDSPIPRSDKYGKGLKKKFGEETSTTGSGISDNKIEATKEMLHVEGKKPSEFLSTTLQPEGTVNPEGQSFGSSRYRIDLSFIDPAFIAHLSSAKGISYYMLKNYEKKEKSDPDKSELISKAKEFSERQMQDKKKGKKDPFGAQHAAEQYPTLSAKEWQALMDVVRTSEVLISSKIPKEALEPA